MAVHLAEQRSMSQTDAASVGSFGAITAFLVCATKTSFSLAQTTDGSFTAKPVS